MPLRDEMPEPLRREPSKPADAGQGDVTGQIERLLSLGLEHEAAGRHQEAIDVWTRVAFLEHGHGRATAYIERGRSAIAERQRQIDELVHRGRAAYEAGAMHDARRCVDEAAARGLLSDDIWELQQRVERYGAVVVPEASVEPLAMPVSARRRSVVLWGLATAGAGVLLTVSFVSRPGTDVLGSLLPGAGQEADPANAGVEMIQAAERLRAEGRPEDAMQALVTITREDPSFDRAEALRAALQREVLARGRARSTQRVERSR